MLQTPTLGEEGAASSPSAVQLSHAIRHQRIHVGEIDRKLGVISSAACSYSLLMSASSTCVWLEAFDGSAVSPGVGVGGV